MFAVENTVGFKRYSCLFVPSASKNHKFVMGIGELPELTGQEVLSNYALVLDLTAIFGAGKEPNLSWCNDNIYCDNGWKYKVQTISFVENPLDPLVFSRDRDTLSEIDYTKDFTNYRTFVYVKGANSITATLDLGQKNGKRRELFLDASSIPQVVDGVTIPEASYKVMLVEEARKLLRTMIVSEFVQGKFYLLGNKEYRKDFYVGIS